MLHMICILIKRRSQTYWKRKINDKSCILKSLKLIEIINSDAGLIFWFFETYKGEESLISYYFKRKMKFASILFSILISAVAAIPAYPSLLRFEPDNKLSKGKTWFLISLKSVISYGRYDMTHMEEYILYVRRYW